MVLLFQLLIFFLLILIRVFKALHDIDDVFNNFCRSTDVQDIVKNIINIESPLLIQSMYIFKQPRIGGEGKIIVLLYYEEY